MKKLKVALNNLVMGRLWAQCRSNIEAAVVPGSGGVVLLGDSITHIGRWEMLFPGLTIYNFGISGERSDQLLTRLAPLTSLRPEKVFLLIGTNDLAIGYSVDEIAANVAGILDQLGDALPACKIHLQTLMPRTAKFTARIKALNAAYARLAQQRGLALIDLFPLFDNGSGAIRKDLSNDDLHLMGAGYDIWRKALAPYLLAAS
jgi:lysophospholipase L1-like esterase